MGEEFSKVLIFKKCFPSMNQREEQQPVESEVENSNLERLDFEKIGSQLDELCA